MADDTQTLTLVAPPDVEHGATITISNPLPDGTVYTVKPDGTVDDVTPEHFTTYLEPMGYKPLPHLGDVATPTPTQDTPTAPLFESEPRVSQEPAVTPQEA